MKYISEENYINRVDEIQKINLALNTLLIGIAKEREMLIEEERRIFKIHDALDNYVFNVGIDSGNPKLRFAFQLGIPLQEDEANIN